MTANGRLPLDPFDEDDSREDIFEEQDNWIHNITIFLYSYETGRNFTITNGTAGSNNASHGDIMRQQPSSTVKHINWAWPDCLVGDGQPEGDDSDRGVYNVSKSINRKNPVFHPFGELTVLRAI